MRKITVLIAILAILLTACGAQAPGPAPAPAPVEVQPTAVPPTAQVIVVTVEVPVQPSEAPAAPQPTATLPPPPTEAPTQAPEPTQEVVETAPSVPAAPGLINVPASLNGPAFENISISSNLFSLRCNPKTITLDLTSTDVYITRVDFYYRIRDKHSTYIPEWSLGGTLDTDGGNHFWINYSGESVKPDNRKAQGWFDIQFVGMNKLGDVVGRSEHIKDLVSYAIDCP